MMTMHKKIEMAFGSFLKFVIRIYQILLAPVLGNNCRFYPNCSNYAIDAITQYGVILGLWLSMKRIARCNPWHHGGLDPVPLSNNVRKPKKKTLTLLPGAVLKNDRQ